MKKIYEKFTSYSNERYAIFDMDEIFEDYIWIIKINEEEFGTILNLYVCDLKKYDMITDEISEKIKSYIENKLGEFGYEIDGAYDFRTSVYYTNILYILNGGDDIGLR